MPPASATSMRTSRSAKWNTSPTMETTRIGTLELRSEETGHEIGKATREYARKMGSRDRQSDVVPQIRAPGYPGVFLPAHPVDKQCTDLRDKGRHKAQGY